MPTPWYGTPGSLWPSALSQSSEHPSFSLRTPAAHAYRMACIAGQAPFLDSTNLFLSLDCPLSYLSFSWVWPSTFKVSFKNIDKPYFQSLSWGLKPVHCCKTWALTVEKENQQLKDGWKLGQKEGLLLLPFVCMQAHENDMEGADIPCVRTQR